MNAYLEEIIQFVEATGFRILFCKNKIALLKEWQHKAFNDPKQIREGLQKWPNAQVAAVVPDDMVILDFDPRHEETPGEHDRFKQQLSETLRTISGRNDGGEHWWFYIPVGTELATAKMPKGVDLRRAGKNYVIIPPSLHNETAQPYRWAGGQLSHLPEQVIEALQPPKRIAPQLPAPVPTGGNLDGLVRTVAEAVEGNRNHALHWAAAKAFDHDNESIIHDIFDAALSGGLPESEVTATIESARRGERRQVEQYSPARDLALAGKHTPKPAATTDNGTPEAPITWDDHNLRSHQRIAARLVQYADGRALYVQGIGWHYWTETHWAQDVRDSFIHAALQTVLKMSWAESMNDKTLQADVRAANTASGSNGVIDLVSKSQRLLTEHVDQDPYLLNCLNGTLDLHTLELRPHDPADRITKITGAGYDPTVPATSWEAFLDSSLPDKEVQGFLQRYAGLSLIGKVVEHVMVMATGITRAGKGTWARSISLALGDYAVEGTNDLLVTGRQGGKSAGDLAAQMVLRGARFVNMAELEKTAKVNESLLKSLTGGDTITAKLMARDFVEFKPSHSFFLQTNYLPAMDADADAAWARLRVVPFNVSFKGREDVHLEDRLATELTGILTWAVEGLRQYQQVGLDEPQAVLASTDEYHSDNDPVARFIEDRCVLQDTSFTPTGQLADEYAKWSTGSGEQPMEAAVLGKQLLNVPGLKRDTVRNTRGFMGIGVKVDGY